MGRPRTGRHRSHPAVGGTAGPHARTDGGGNGAPPRPGCAGAGTIGPACLTPACLTPACLTPGCAIPTGPLPIDTIPIDTAPIDAGSAGTIAAPADRSITRQPRARPPGADRLAMACNRQHAGACILAAGRPDRHHDRRHVDAGPSIGSGHACHPRTGAGPARCSGTRSRAATASGSTRSQPDAGRRLATARARDGLAGRSSRGRPAAAPHARPPAIRWPGTGARGRAAAMDIDAAAAAASPRGQCDRLAGAAPRSAPRCRPDIAVSAIRAHRHTSGCAAIARPRPGATGHAGNRTRAAARGAGPAGRGNARNRLAPGIPRAANPGLGSPGAGHVRSAVARGCTAPAIRRPPAAGTTARAEPVHDSLRTGGTRRWNVACPGATCRGCQRRCSTCRRRACRDGHLGRDPTDGAAA